MLRRKCVWISTLVIIATVIIGPNSYAANDTTDFSIKVNPSLNLSVSSNAVGFRLTPTKEGDFGSASFDVYASTNNPTGYKLIMSTDKINLESDTINPTTGAKPTIPTLAQDGISPAVFEASTDSNILNHYGVAIKNGDYNAMKSTQEIEKTTVNNVTEDTIAVSLATKLNLLTVPGVYSTTLNFQIVANIYTKGGSINEDGNYPAKSLLRAFEIAYTEAGKQMYIEDANTDIGWRPMVGADFDTVGGKEVRFAMQDISMTFEENGVTQNVCEWATASTADNSYINEAPVMDLRDGKTYWIAKLADGKCWMTQNLDYNITGPVTSELSDINVTNNEGYSTSKGYSVNGNIISWTPTQLTTLPSGISASGTATWDFRASYGYSLDPGDWYNDGEDPHASYNYLAGTTGGHFKKDEPYDNNGEHGHVGNYYAYAAVIATNDVSYWLNDTDYYNSASAPQNSICPKGWKLPLENAVNHDYGNLMTTYNLYNSTYHDLVSLAPLHFLESGLFAGGLDLAGYYGIYLGSVYDGSKSYGLEFGRSIMRTELINYTAYYHGPGKSVRCIAK